MVLIKFSIKKCYAKYLPSALYLPKINRVELGKMLTNLFEDPFGFLRLYLVPGNQVGIEIMILLE